tara:strand:- start:6719 stop:7012 length:294 start_codon:yes stop_codon:yes gene_type:complete
MCIKGATNLFDTLCLAMFGHNNWENVNPKLLKRNDDENYTVILFHHKDTRIKESNNDTVMTKRYNFVVDLLDEDQQRKLHQWYVDTGVIEEKSNENR